MNRWNYIDFWSPILTLKAAIVASRSGVLAACVCALLEGVLALMGGFKVVPWLDFKFTMVASMVLFVVCGWGIWRFSRVAAALALLLYLFKQGWQIQNASKFEVWTVLVIAWIIALYLRGLRGTVTYHRLKLTAGA